MMSRLFYVLAFGLTILSPPLAAQTQPAKAPSSPASSEDPLSRGTYLVQIMGCYDCHSPRGPNGAPMPEKGLIGGTIGFEMPGLGIFWPPNLTPDPTGLGGWSDEAIIVALRTGLRPDGRMLAPVMPWPTFSVLTNQDAEALVTYLRAQPAVANTVPPFAATAAEAKGAYFSVVVPK